jgi:hypothetical protein
MSVMDLFTEVLEFSLHKPLTLIIRIINILQDF